MAALIAAAVAPALAAAARAQAGPHSELFVPPAESAGPPAAADEAAPAVVDRMRVTVKGNVSGYQPTGVVLHPGDRLRIEATGGIVFNRNRKARGGTPGPPTTDPDGVGNDRRDGRQMVAKGKFLAGAVFGSLVGEIATTPLAGGRSPHTDKPGSGFVGRSYDYVVETEGELNLGYNDNAFSDNAGEFVAEVVVERARR